MTARRVVTAFGVTVFILAALLLGGWEMQSEAEACAPLDPQPVTIGADYSRGVWVAGTGEIIGFSLEEDSVIVGDADCV